MKLKLSQIVNSEAPLKKLMELKLPFAVAYKLNKLAFNIQPELTIYHKQHNDLVKELGEPAPDSEEGGIRVKKENLSKFMEEIQKVENIEVDLKFGKGKELEKIKVSEFGDVNVEAKDLLALNWLLED